MATTVTVLTQNYVPFDYNPPPLNLPKHLLQRYVDLQFKLPPLCFIHSNSVEKADSSSCAYSLLLQYHKALGKVTETPNSWKLCAATAHLWTWWTSSTGSECSHCRLLTNPWPCVKKHLLTQEPAHLPMSSNVNEQQNGQTTEQPKGAYKQD